jgi:hypothetical protein
VSQCHVSSSPKPGPPTWPGITELLTVPGTTQVTLNVQVPLMCAIIQPMIQNAIHNLHAVLFFGDAFSKPTVTLVLIKDVLIVSAEGYKPDSQPIHECLMFDNIYLTEMALLVSFWSQALLG